MRRKRWWRKHSELRARSAASSEVLTDCSGTTGGPRHHDGQFRTRHGRRAGRHRLPRHAERLREWRPPRSRTRCPRHQGRRRFPGADQRNRRQLRQAQPRGAPRSNRHRRDLHRALRSRAEDRRAGSRRRGAVRAIRPAGDEGRLDRAAALPRAHARPPAHPGDARHAVPAPRFRRRRRALRRARHALAAGLRVVVERPRARFHGALLGAATRRLGREPAPAAQARRRELRHWPRAPARRATRRPARGTLLAVAAIGQRRAVGLRRREQLRLLLAPLAQDARLRRARSARVARLAPPGAPGRNGARADDDPRPHRGQDADLRERAPHAPLQRRLALGDQPRQGAHGRHRAAAAPGGRRGRHHRAQALRGRALQGEGKRADHAAVDRRRRDHHRPAPDHRVPQPRRGGPDRVALRGGAGQEHRRHLPRLPRGNLRAAREPAVGGHPPQPRDQVRAADAAHQARRQRDVHREHRLADPRRIGRGVGRRARVPRREREPRAEPQAVLSREPRHPHRAGEPSRVRVTARALAQECARARGLVRALPPRRGPVQDHQRHLRPQRRATRCWGRSARC